LEGAGGENRVEGLDAIRSPDDPSFSS